MYFITLYYNIIQYAATVKALIDAGTCSPVSTTSNCGDDATGYYETFEYNGQRVIVVSGAPDHAAETDFFLDNGRANPNVRCKYKTQDLFSYLGHMHC